MLEQSLRRQIRVLKNHRLNEFCEDIAFGARCIQKESSEKTLLQTYDNLKKLYWRLGEKLDKIELEMKKVRSIMDPIIRTLC